LLFTGCAGFTGASLPDASVNPSQTPLGTISGSNYGGHAPLVGAHVYVLQPSVTTGSSSGTAEFNAYGFQATSLLSASYTSNGATYPATIQNSADPNIPASWYYVQTDSSGAFNITGDYSCTAGLPVYLYLYGGSPTYPAATNTFNITQFVYTTDPSGGYDVTMTIDTTGSNAVENAYLQEGLKITSTSATTPVANLLNGSFQYVLPTNLTTTTFSFIQPSLPSGATLGTTYTQPSGSMQVTFQPSFNRAVVNLAVLGNCPSSGTFSGANAISYVYANEVSTVAAAYAFRPFMLADMHDDMTHIGTSGGNVAGLQNAAVIAKQLYDITGSQISTSYAGEGHIANTTTVAGNGIVPQANIDTLANILAACVDSNNGSTTVGTSGSYNTTTGAYTGISPQCNTLFQNATNTGIPTTSTVTGANAP
jgi:hypothetical protein